MATEEDKRLRRRCCEEVFTKADLAVGEEGCAEAEHGLYCLGCCWLLFVIFFPLGMMNVTVLAVVTVLIFAEKSLPLGPRIAQRDY